MSTRVMAQVWPVRMPHAEKAVLVSLADQANDAGVCWPSVGSIALRVCLHERTVRRALEWLEAQGALETTERRGHSSVYRLTPEAFAFEEGDLFIEPNPGHSARGDSMPGVTQRPVTPGTAPGPPRAQRPDTPGTAPGRTVIEPSVEPSRNRCGARFRAPPPANGGNEQGRDTQRGHRLPDGWEPSAKDQQFAQVQLGDDWRESLATFRDHWRAQPGTKGRKLDWSATWRNWVRKDHRDRRRGQGEGRSSTLTAMETLLRRRLS